jgi:hypothetical protein
VDLSSPVGIDSGVVCYLALGDMPVEHTVRVGRDSNFQDQLDSLALRLCNEDEHTAEHWEKHRTVHVWDIVAAGLVVDSMDLLDPVVLNSLEHQIQRAALLALVVDILVVVGRMEMELLEEGKQIRHGLEEELGVEQDYFLGRDAVPGNVRAAPSIFRTALIVL